MAISRPIAFVPIPGVSETGKSRHRGFVRLRTVSSLPSEKNPENFQHHNVEIPKTEPFGGGRIGGWMKEPSLIQKAANAIMDHCCTLEGEESYHCWEAFFEFENMVQKEARSRARSPTPSAGLERVENLVRQSGGVKDLIDNVHMVAKASRLREGAGRQKEPAVLPSADDAQRVKRRPFPEPDGLPKTQQELEEEEKALMPDSSYTRMLRRKGRFPAWYSPHPDHETD